MNSEIKMGGGVPILVSPIYPVLSTLYFANVLWLIATQKLPSKQVVSCCAYFGDCQVLNYVLLCKGGDVKFGDISF